MAMVAPEPWYCKDTPGPSGEVDPGRYSMTIGFQEISITPPPGSPRKPVPGQGWPLA